MTKNDKLLELVLEYQKTKSIIVLNKIIALNQSLINWYLKNTSLNISKEDLYSMIIKGLEYSISRYDKDKSDNIISYISLGIRNIIYKNKIYIEEDRNRLFASFLDYKRLIEKRYGVTLEKDFSILEDIIDLMVEDNIIREETKEGIKKTLIELLKDYYGSLKIINTKDGNEILNSNVEIPTDSSYIKRLLKGTLTPKEYEYLVSYYGLFENDSYSLEEIGKKEHVSRVNINNINNNSLDKLRYIFNFYNQRSIWNINANKFKLLLQELLTDEEYFYLTSYYGLFDNTKKTHEELKKLKQIGDKKIASIIDQAISKIFFYIEYQDIKFPYSEIELKNILKSNLSDYEYNTFVTIYGLFGNDIKTTNEYANLNNIDRERVLDTIARVNSKIKRLISKDKVILEFLQTILSKEEFDYLSLRYGLIDGERLNNKTIGAMFNQKPQVVNRIVNLSLEKIKIKLKSINIAINKNLVQEVLENLLTKEEYEYLCKTYGIFGYERVNRDSIVENEIKLAHANIKSFTRVAAILNIESKGR